MVVDISKKEDEKMEKVKMDFSVQKEESVKKLLAMLAILSPKQVIKYKKTMNKKAEFPIRLVIPDPSFTMILSKLEYLRIKRMLEKAKVNYSHIFIVQ